MCIRDRLRKVVYATDENWKERMPENNEDNDLEQELSYCGKLEKEIESDEVLRSFPKVQEKLNLLKETLEDTQDHYTLSKDPDARTGHKTADSSFFGFKTHIAMTCLLYTSDAADEEDSVDLGGRRII